MLRHQHRSPSSCDTSSFFKFAVCLLVAFMLSAGCKTASAETLSWDARPATNLFSGGSDVALINGVTITTTSSRSGSFDSAGLNQHEIQPTTSMSGYTGFVFSVFNGTTGNGSNSQTTTLTFSEPVYDLSFAVGDIDGGTTYNDGTNSFTDIVEFRANGGAVLPTTGTPVDASKVSWTASTGRARAISNANLTDTTSGITIAFAGPVTSITIRHIGGNTAISNPTQQAIVIDDVSFRRAPRLALKKTSAGDFGTFTYSITNGPSGTFTTTVTTTASGAPATGTQFRLGAAATATTITETVPTGWQVGSTALCTDANAANSGNPASFNATISSSAFTIPAGNMRSGAELTCALTNSKLPTLQLRKISNGGTGPFSFSGNNGYGSATITTSASGTAASAAVHILSNANTATTIVETIPPNYFISAISCTGLGAGSATPTLSNGNLVLNAAATAPGNVIVCTYSNDVVNPALSILKTANTSGPVNSGEIITYTYRVTNIGNQLIAGVTISELFNGTGTPPVPRYESLVADAAPAGDSSDSSPNNGSWSNLAPGDAISFTSTYTVQLRDIEQLQ
jgi:hypothetical protein